MEQEIPEIHFPRIFHKMKSIQIKYPFRDENNVMINIEKIFSEKPQYQLKVISNSMLLTQALEKTGIYPMLKKEELNQKILDFYRSEKIRENEDSIVDYGHRSLFIAFDSNAVMNNIKYLTFSDLSQEDIQKILFLLSRATSHEFFFKANLVIKEEQNYRLHTLFQRNPYFAKLFPSSSQWKRYNKLNHRKTLGREGRKGVAGLIKYYEISKDNALIAKFHHHPYYHEPILRRLQAETTVIGIDSIYDALILSEFEQFLASTNAHIIFLTGDKNLATMAKILGIDTFLVEFEHDEKKVKEGVTVTEEQIARLISEMAVEYDALEFTVEQEHGAKKTFLLSFADKAIHSKEFKEFAFLYSVKQHKLFRLKLIFTQS